MATIIKIEINKLQGYSSTLSQRITELQTLNTRLQTLISDIDASWDGDASEKYSLMLQGYLEKAKKMVGVLTEYKRYVDNAINKFSNLDKNSASTIIGIF